MNPGSGDKFVMLHVMLQEFGIDGIYVVHAKKGYELHEARIRDLFGSFGMEYELVTEGDPSCFSDELLHQYFIPEIRDVLREGIISCTLNHILSYERIVKNKNKFALVFENDPFFLGNFPEKIAKIASEAQKLDKGFMISLENTTLEFPPTRSLRKGQLLYEASRGRCAGAYMMDLEAARKILEDLKTRKCHTVIDWWHNSLITNHIVRMYWADPPLTEQGSHNGRMASTISSKNRNLMRQLQWNVQKGYKMYIARWFK